MRNLTPGEIYDQVVAIKEEAETYFQRPLTNIVFMGMGEPLLNYANVIEAIDKIRDTATSHDRLFFVEVMGRDAGFIAINAGIGSAAAAILIPERKTPIETLAEKLKTRTKAKKSSNIVIVAEGGKSGSAQEIADKVKILLPYYDIKVTILGHLQRGGSPTSSDRLLASKLGVAAVEGLLQGKYDVMAGMINHKVVYTPIVKAIVDDKVVDEEDLRVANILST
jgi:6-phosphofructokinase 1